MEDEADIIFNQILGDARKIGEKVGTDHSDEFSLKYLGLDACFDLKFHVMLLHDQDD